jgi:hypothetical protein
VTEDGITKYEEILEMFLKEEDGMEAFDSKVREAFVERGGCS